MRIQSVRDLKAELLETVVAPALQLSIAATPSVRALAAEALPRALTVNDTVGIAAAAFDALPKVFRSVALGVTKRGREHELAVRVQRESLLKSHMVEHIVRKARGEANVRLIGRLEKRPTPRRARAKAATAAGAWQRGRVRPLQIGVSVGHFKVTAGTLGAFVSREGHLFMLSNNHVLANENNAQTGDPALQPGRIDGGDPSADIVGQLHDWVALQQSAPNRVDAAIASIDDSAGIDPGLLKGICKGKDWRLAGLGPDFLDEGTLVYKVGRTTGATAGRVTAFDLDNVVVQYDMGNLRFNGQIEIEGAGKDAAFSAGGDSGSLIVNADKLAVALLFAGGDAGGHNGLGLTYANPIHTVLTDLQAELVY